MYAPKPGQIYGGSLSVQYAIVSESGKKNAPEARGQAEKWERAGRIHGLKSTNAKSKQALASKLLLTVRNGPWCLRGKNSSEASTADHETHLPADFDRVLFVETP